MLNKTSEQTGFLPDDYVKGRAERRTNIMAITLFVVVMGGVALAYVATDRTWNDVRSARAAINQRYQDAGARIEEMKAYEERVARIVDKAHIAVGLLDSVPRSNLLAEIVGRMPDTLSLTRFNLETTEIKAPKEKPAAVGSISTRGAAKSPSRSPAPNLAAGRPPSNWKASRRPSRRSRCSSTRWCRWTCSDGCAWITPVRWRSTIAECVSSACSSSSIPMPTSVASMRLRSRRLTWRRTDEAGCP